MFNIVLLLARSSFLYGIQKTTTYIPLKWLVCLCVYTLFFVFVGIDAFIVVQNICTLSGR